LIYYIASVDHSLIRRDAKRVAEWDIERIIPCHGDVIDHGGSDAWASTYEWFLKGQPEGTLISKIKVPFMKLMRWVFLM
jgi:flavorubredoxin